MDTLNSLGILRAVARCSFPLRSFLPPALLAEPSCQGVVLQQRACAREISSPLTWHLSGRRGPVTWHAARTRSRAPMPLPHGPGGASYRGNADFPIPALCRCSAAVRGSNATKSAACFPRPRGGGWRSQVPTRQASGSPAPADWPPRRRRAREAIQSERSSAGLLGSESRSGRACARTSWWGVAAQAERPRTW